MKHIYQATSVRNFALLCIGGYMLSVAYGVTFLIPLMVDQRGGNEVFAGAVISVAAISTLLSVVLSGHIADKFGTTISVAFSGMFLSVSMFGFFISEEVGNNLLLYGFILGGGWGMFYTLGPILVAAIIEPARRTRFFALLSGSMMSGIGSGPLIGRFVTFVGHSIEIVFCIAGILNVIGVVIYLYLNFSFKKNKNLMPHVSSLSFSAIYAVLSSNAIFSIIMVGLGACVFGGLSSFQTVYAKEFGFDYSVFFIGFMVAAIGSRLFLSSYVVKKDPYISSFFLTLMIVISIILFIMVTDSVYFYFIFSVILGLGYGLNYSVINGLAANEAPDNMMPQSLLFFSLSYLLCVFGFPLLAGKIIYEEHIIIMFYVILGIASIKCMIAFFRIWQVKYSIKMRKKK